MEKYLMAIELMNAIDVQSNDTHAQWDALYSFIHANFPAPTSSAEHRKWLTVIEAANSTSDEVNYVNECAKLLRAANLELLIEQLTKLPPEYSDIVFPIAITRYLLGVKRVRLTPAKVTTFDEFHRRYGILIVRAIYQPVIQF